MFPFFSVGPLYPGVYQLFGQVRPHNGVVKIGIGLNVRHQLGHHSVLALAGGQASA